jgi:hypothetical protein
MFSAAAKRKYFFANNFNILMILNDSVPYFAFLFSVIIIDIVLDIWQQILYHIVVLNYR